MSHSSGGLARFLDLDLDLVVVLDPDRWGKVARDRDEVEVQDEVQDQVVGPRGQAPSICNLTGTEVRR